MDTIIGFSQKFSGQKGVTLLLAASLLALPMSSTAKSICLSLAIAAIFLTPAYRAELTGLFAKGWCKAAILLFFIALVACLWSPASYSERILIVEKYSKLLYLPILVVGFGEAKTRNAGLHAFLLAMLITCSLAILKFHGYLHSLAIDPDQVFRNHIMTGFMVAFSAYLSVLFCYRQRGWLRIAYGLLALTCSYQVLFLNLGRTGYVIYFLLMALLVLQLCSWRQALAGLFLVGALVTLTYMQNPVVKIRVDSAVQELKKYKEKDGKNTNIGYRLQFQDYAHKLFNKHPFFGNGTASFAHYFNTEKPVPAWVSKLLEPHSQYWLIAAEFGLFGLAALLLFLVSLFKASCRLKSMRPIAFAMLIPFVLGNLSDSLLLYSGSGYFFILFMALCLGEQTELDKKTQASN